MKHEFNTTGRAVLGDSALVPAKGSLTVDVEKYQAFLDGSGMTDAQKEDFLQALWVIIVNFVDLGFEVHPAQEVCGKDATAGTDHSKGAFDAVRSEQPSSENNPLDSGHKGSLENE